ncbi:MAG: tetratricopeptide repeat protein, partial [Candidatus Muiribacteriota bacterium]
MKIIGYIIDTIKNKINKRSEKLPDVDKILPPKILKKKEPELSKAEKKYTMAELALKSNDYRAAVFHSREAATFNPKMSGPFLIMGTSYMRQHLYIEALRILNRGVEFTGSFEIHEKIEEVYEAQGKRKKIVKMWNDFIQSSRKKDVGYKALARFYEYKEKKLDKAIEYYEKVVQINDVNIDVYEKLGNLYLLLKEYTKAANAFNKLLFSKHAKEYFRNSSNKARILTKVGEIFYLNNDFPFAFKYFDMSLQAVPGGKHPYMRLGDIAYYVRDMKNTIRYYKLSYQADETDIEMIVKLAVIYYLNQKFEEALHLIKKVQRYNPLLSNVKEIVEAIENKEEVKDENLYGIVEENTDLLLDHKYNREFEFPASKEELDKMRQKLNSVDAKMDFDEEEDKKNMALTSDSSDNSIKKEQKEKEKYPDIEVKKDKKEQKEKEKYPDIEVKKDKKEQKEKEKYPDIEVKKEKKEEVSEKPQRESSEQKSEDILKEEGGQKMEKE